MAASSLCNTQHLAREREKYFVFRTWDSWECWRVCYLLSVRYITVHHMSTFVTYDEEIDCFSSPGIFLINNPRAWLGSFGWQLSHIYLGPGWIYLPLPGIHFVSTQILNKISLISVEEGFDIWRNIEPGSCNLSTGSEQNTLLFISRMSRLSLSPLDH